MKKPDFIIIGAMKCATTTLQEQLSAQPGIEIATNQGKEINFFSDDKNYKKGINWYFSLFNKDKSKIQGERSTHYTKLPKYKKTTERLKKHIPNTKLIYIIRHPIDRLVSHYIHNWSENKIKININNAIYKYPELIDYSRYSMQIDPYIKKFPKSNILIIFFESMITNSQEELDKICKFIGYKKKPTWFNKKGKNKSNERIKKNLLFKILASPFLRTLRHKILKKNTRVKLTKIWTIKKRPKLNKKNIEYLEKIFDKDLAELSKILNLKLNCKNFKEKVTQSNFCCSQN